MFADSFLGLTLGKLAEGLIFYGALHASIMAIKWLLIRTEHQAKLYFHHYHKTRGHGHGHHVDHCSDCIVAVAQS